MLRGCVASSMRVVHNLQTPVRCSVHLLRHPWLPAAPLKRNSSSGSVREAARNAKATLLRATSLVNAAQADAPAAAVAPGFVDLAVDDRVLVSVLNSVSGYLHTDKNQILHPGGQRLLGLSCIAVPAGTPC